MDSSKIGRHCSRVSLMNESREIPWVEPVDRAIKLLKRSNRRQLIALAGLPGSGKSTLATQIADDINRTIGFGTAVALGMDGFHLPKSVLAEMPDPAEAIKRRGAPWTFDSSGFCSRVRALAGSSEEKSVYWPGFEHGVGDPVEDEFSVKPKVRLVLIEGLYLLNSDGAWGEAGKLFDEKWFLDTPMEESIRRLAGRHMTTRNIGLEEAMVRINRNDRLNAEIVLASRPKADFLVLSRQISPSLGHDGSL